ncbi:MAG: TIGR04282 family arsenosugar biosynthesis glycosyltransferase [Chlorobiota bacterium]|nr:MAG: TIGR04282 family arsenosugar biosynthesis glycosyltransferase [Chlorobiota bacterium]
MDVNLKSKLIIFCKYPKPGYVKTRLVPPLSFDEACELYKCFLLDSLELYDQIENVEKEIYLDNFNDLEVFKNISCNKYEIRFQKGNSLGDKISNAISDTLNNGFQKVIVIGSDSPTLPISYLTDCFNNLDNYDVVFGETDDGGYYCVGSSVFHSEIFNESLMFSTDTLLNNTIDKCNELNISFYIGKRWYDIDDYQDLKTLWSHKNLLKFSLTKNYLELLNNKYEFNK